MTHFKSWLLSTLILGAAACSPGADIASDTPSETAQTTAFDTAAMDALLSGAVERGEVIGVQALVFDEGKTVYRNSFGLSVKTANRNMKTKPAP